MIRLSSNLWTAIIRYGANSRHKLAAIAFVSDDSRIKFGRGDTLIVDASNERIESGETSAHVLRRAFRKGAQIYSLPKLHGKLMVFDNHVIVGSTNISESSATRLKEIGIIADTPQLIKDAHSMMDNLRQDRKCTRVDKPFVERICKIKVTRRGGTGGGQEDKPTILEAFRMNSPNLNDFVFYMVEAPAELDKRLIEKEAKKADMRLPKTWTWWEFPSKKYFDTLINRLFAKKKFDMLILEVKSSNGRIQSFDRLLSSSYEYDNHIPIGETIAFVCKEHKRLPFKTNGTAEQFCPKLNHSLQANPSLRTKLYNHNSWILEAKEIAELLRKGM